MSIDILTAFVFAVSVWRGVLAIYHNHLNLRDKIYIAGFTLAAALYIFQTIMQTQTGMIASTVIWNVINGIHAFLTISIITLISKRSTKDESS